MYRHCTCRVGKKPYQSINQHGGAIRFTSSYLMKMNRNNLTIICCGYFECQFIQSEKSETTHKCNRLSYVSEMFRGSQRGSRATGRELR
jgi:hypothetical protein